MNRDKIVDFEIIRVLLIAGLAEFHPMVFLSVQETETALSAYANALRRREALRAGTSRLK